MNLIIPLISFIFGAFTAYVIAYAVFNKKLSYTKEQLIKIQTKAEANESLQDIIKRDFVQLANETIKKEQEDLRKQNRESLEEKIMPLTKELGEFKAKVEKFNLAGAENTTKIVEQITNLEKNNKLIEQETKNLVEALTKNQNIKGAYGEDLLDTILQNCGMQEGIHYQKQFVTTSSNLRDDTNHIVRPDIVINLPDNRHIIIDSKVTLTSYLEYIEDETKLKNFKAEVKKRIIDLSDKNYQNAGDLSQPDFVLMYMPIETSLNLIYDDSELINTAYKANVIIVGTSSLLATIRLVNQLFAQQRQSECISKIVTAGTNLYETFVQFCEDLIDVQKRFEGISSLLNKTINRFKRSNKNKPSLFSQIETLKEYGITTTKQIPPELLEEDEEESLDDNEKDCILDGALIDG